jgi:phospholipid/cholesterol/gamma-HCH transport system ATP-binding protein
VAERLGHEAAQEAISSLGVYIDKHFSAVGGFSTRHSLNEYVTVLPATDLAEAEGILGGFINDFQLQEQAILDIWSAAQRQSDSQECVALTMLAGLAQGQPSQELEAVIDHAKHQQKVIARIRCITQGESR